MNALSGAESIEEYYQLSHDPFAARTPGFKFYTPQRKTVLAQLHHLARFGDQVLLVTGPEGSGKTLLRQVLVASSNKDTTQCVVTTAREFPGEAALTAFFCQAVNAGDRDPESLLLRADQLRETGVNLYLVIDDADLLEQDALQALVDLSRAGGEDPALRIFLFADERIQPMLDSVDAQEEGAEWLHRIPLQPYTLEETQGYLAQRLDAAGQGIELLDDEQIEWIHRHSGGWPGRINDAARQSMREAMQQQEVPVAGRRSAMPVKSLAAVALIAVGIGFAWFMGERQEEPATTVLELPEPVATVDATDDPQLAELTELNAEPGVRPGTPGAQEPAQASAESAEALPETAAERPALVNLFPSTGGSSASAGAGSPAATEAAEVTEPAPAQSRPEVAAEAAPATPSPSPARQSEPAPATAAAPVRESAPAPAESAPQSSSQPVASAQGAAWYQAQPSGNYVLQVLGSRSRAAAADFIAANSGVTGLRYFQTTHQGEPWFVVTQGNYASRQQAQQGIAGLPAAMRGASPWPRSIGDIKQALD